MTKNVAYWTRFLGGCLAQNFLVESASTGEVMSLS